MIFALFTATSRRLAFAIMMTSSDLCASAKPWDIQLDIVKIIFEEFYAQVVISAAEVQGGLGLLLLHSALTYLVIYFLVAVACFLLWLSYALRAAGRHFSVCTWCLTGALFDAVCGCPVVMYLGRWSHFSIGYIYGQVRWHLISWVVKADLSRHFRFFV